MKYSIESKIVWHKCDEILPEDILPKTERTLKGGLGKRIITPLVLTVQENNLRIGCARRCFIEEAGKWCWIDGTISSFRKCTHWATFNRPEEEFGVYIDDVFLMAREDERKVKEFDNF